MTDPTASLPRLSAPTLEECQALLAAEPEHPVWILPQVGQVAALLARGPEGVELVQQILQQRRERMKLEAADPLRHGVKLKSWERADAQLVDRAACNELLIMGGNRAAKTEYAARAMVQILMSKADREVWCFQTSEKNSILMQQPRVWHYLPPEVKAARNGKVTAITYTKKNGFTGGRFVMPNGSLCDFRNYMQNPDTIEGGEIDGCWCDELVPLSWLQTLRYRLMTRNGLMLVTFTPIQGYTPTVKKYLDGATTLEETEAELLRTVEPDPGKRMVPLVQRAYDPPTARVVYFHTAENPFNPFDRFRTQLANAPRAEILTRAYGVPEKAVAGKFPKYNEKVHVLTPERWQAVRRGTWYHVADPCNGRNFYMIWAVVTPDRRIIVRREWPQPGDYIPGVGNPGMWAIPDGEKFDGARGDAQQPFGFGLRRYKEEFDRVEHKLGADWPRQGTEEDIGRHPDNLKLRVHERIMDSRFGNAPTLAAGETSTLIEQFEDLEPEGVEFVPAPGVALEEGITLINDALDYDATAEVSALNQPRLYVHEDCRNLRFALQTWTGQDGKHGACKDPIDVLRYLLLSDPVHVESGRELGLAGGPGGWRKGTFARTEE